VNQTVRTDVVLLEHLELRFEARVQRKKLIIDKIAMPQRHVVGAEQRVHVPKVAQSSD
jgi:hypothetical protein